MKAGDHDWYTRNTSFTCWGQESMPMGNEKVGLRGSSIRGGVLSTKRFMGVRIGSDDLRLLSMQVAMWALYMVIRTATAGSWNVSLTIAPLSESR